MIPIAQIVVPRANKKDAVIELLAGDLTAIPPDHAVDILVVSAFPNDYTPMQGTLIGSLMRKGLSIAELAAYHKEEGADLSNQLGCWLSQELTPASSTRFNFKRVLCFEPRTVSNQPEQVVTNVFRCLNNFIIPDIATTEVKQLRSDLNISKVAMPLLAAGNQKVPRELMLPAILDAGIFWLQQGLPLTNLKLVLYQPSPADIQFCKQVFEQFRAKISNALYKEKFEATPITQQGWKEKLSGSILELIEDKLQEYLLGDLYAVADEDEKVVLDRLIAKMNSQPISPQNTASGYSTGIDSNFDLFISYPHVHQKEVNEFVAALKKAYPKLKVFYDRESIPAGGLWIRKIYDAIQSSANFIAILSPEYRSSEVCWDEFQCAKLKEYNTKKSVIKTISFYEDQNLPPIMGIYSWIDCTIGDVEKLKDAATKVLNQI